MNSDPGGDDWERLRAERAALRGDVVGTLDAIKARAEDPFGLKA